jgi:hypothetical protein
LFERDNVVNDLHLDSLTLVYAIGIFTPGVGFSIFVALGTPLGSIPTLGCGCTDGFTCAILGE